MKTSLKNFWIISLITNIIFLLIQVSIMTPLILCQKQLQLSNSDLSQIFFGILIIIILVMFITNWILVKNPLRKLNTTKELAPWQADLGFYIITKYSHLETEYNGYIWYLKKKDFIILATLGINFGFALISAVVFSILG
ncbi:hypothetical protein SKUN_00352 [Spiroplasma kunkelii CR2-3x]|uniref:Uncharacterized protein n=1 Tax=Spiroplasma kunkelii CR2-3x TaxID=273035 RepID=A0A0K2JFS0_SPIKU|nr:hypothetical protein [Spiroplasma kunkelii]ALA97268.1 hypothetical protein SKUN_00352 [Spiroplasma kunkelii CR2-3x]